MYDFDIKHITQTTDIINTINEFGICRIPNYTNVSKLYDEVFDIIKDTPEKSYKFGKLKVLSNNLFFNYEEISEKLRDINLNKISNRYINNVITEAIITHDYRNDNGIAKNGYLHYDKKHSLKFFIYLTDITENDGPFSVIPKTHIVGKQLREDNPNKTSNVFFDYPELCYKKDDILPIIGKAGDIIIFDTDIFHLGGLLNGGERLTLKGHAYDMKWDSLMNSK